MIAVAEASKRKKEDSVERAVRKRSNGGVDSRPIDVKPIQHSSYRDISRFASSSHQGIQQGFR